MALETLIQIVTEQLKNIAHTEVHVGKPMQLGDTFVVPVSKISMGFGAGGFGADVDAKQGQGTGGGVSVEPVAFLVVRHDQVELLHVNAPGSPAGKLIELLPDVIEQVTAYIQHTKERED